MDLQALKKYYSEHLPVDDIFKFVQGALLDSRLRELALIRQIPVKHSKQPDEGQGTAKKPAETQEIFSRPHVCDTAANLRALFCGANGVDNYLPPVRMEIGAVYTTRPMKGQLTNATPDNKELIFDIDLTDYDPIRTCCQGKEICNVCWQYMIVAARIVRHVMEGAFAFEHILPVFSGRRGIHLWVCDAAARLMTDGERRTVVAMMDLKQKKGALVRGATDYAEDLKQQGPRGYGRQFIIKQCLTAFEANVGKGLGFMLCEEDMQALPCPMTPPVETNPEDTESDTETEEDDGAWDKRQGRLLGIVIKAARDLFGLEVGALTSINGRTVQQFQEQSLAQSVANVRFTRLKELIGDPNLKRLALHFFAPQLDANVTASKKHLLKAPFLVHPGTGHVCVPIPDLETFRPEISVSLDDLVGAGEARPGTIRQFKEARGMFSRFVGTLPPADVKSE